MMPAALSLDWIHHFIQRAYAYTYYNLPVSSEELRVQACIKHRFLFKFSAHHNRAQLGTAQGSLATSSLTGCERVLAGFSLAAQHWVLPFDLYSTFDGKK